MPAEPLRILHVCDYFMPSFGYQECLLPKWHVRHGHETHVITGDRYAPVPDYDSTFGSILGPRRAGTGTDRIDGFDVHRLPVSFERRGRIWIRGLTREIAALKPDAVFAHSTTSVTAFRLARYAARSGVPLFIDCHMVFSAQDVSRKGNLFYRGLRSATERFLTPHVSKFFGVAAECCDFLSEAQGIPQEKIGLLPLGLDEEIFHFDAAAGRRVRADLGIPAEAVVVLQTGKFSSDKRPEWLSTSLAPVMARRPDVHLVFVGSGSPEYIDKIREPVVAVGSEQRLHFVPMVDVNRLRDFYSASDIAVYPEASSLSAVEAAGCGVAVVMTDLPAGKWRAELGVGVCYPTGDLSALEDTLERLVDDPIARKALGTSARAAVEAQFSYAAVAQDLEAMMAAASESIGDRVE